MIFNPHKYPSYRLLISAAIFFTVIFVSAAFQGRSRLELLHADFSRGFLENGIPLKILQGNVHARQDSLELYCNRAVYNEQSSVIDLTGNVHLYRGRDTLLAKEVRYFEKNKVAIAEGNVQVFRPAQEMRSDYLEYNYSNDHIRARGKLFLHDEDNIVFITARQGEYLPDMKYTYVQGKAHLWRIDSTSTDTLHIYSRKMEYFFGEHRRAVARDSVNIYQGNLHATCDSAVYQIAEDIIYLMSQPVAIQENNRMSGLTMQLILHNQELRRIVVEQQALAISMIDSATQKENRLEGKELIMYITDRKLREIQAISNARSFYYLREKEEEQGINVASADTIKAFLKNDELDSIAVIGGSQGIYYPPDYKGKIIQE